MSGWVAGATVVGAGIGAYGANKSSKDQKKSADKATAAASAADAKALAFEQKRYDDWNATYGPMQDNLAEYYSSVTPDYYAAVGLETFEQEYQTSLQRISESFEQTGIDMTSGIAASTMAQAELGAAESRANIRREAPQQAMEDKSRFLQIGLGQNPASSVTGALSQASQTAHSNAVAAQNRHAVAQQQVGQAYGDLAQVAIRGIDAYTTPKPTNPNNYWD